MSSHLHFNLTYLLEVDENEELHIKEDENSGVKWINIDEVEKYSAEKWMNEEIYRKNINKIKNKRGNI